MYVLSVGLLYFSAIMSLAVLPVVYQDKIPVLTSGTATLSIVLNILEALAVLSVLNHSDGGPVMIMIALIMWISEIFFIGRCLYLIDKQNIYSTAGKHLMFVWGVLNMIFVIVLTVG